MDVATTANWFGILSGLALGGTWFWKIVKWLSARNDSAKESARIGGRIVSELLDVATSPARRADIHTFILFRCTQIEADSTRRFFRSLLFGVIFLVVGVLTVSIFRLIEFKGIEWLWWFLVINSLIAVVAFFYALFFEYQLKRINEAWQATARKVLGERAVRHVNTT